MNIQLPTHNAQRSSAEIALRSSAFVGVNSAVNGLRSLTSAVCLLASVLLLSSFPAQGALLTFRQGDGSAYSITDGAKIWQANPGNNYPAEVTLDVTASSSPVNDRRTLLSFPAILGSSPGQIPLGSTIVSGQLSLKTSASSSAGTTDTLNLFQVLTSWSEGTVTWSSFNSGGQSGVDYATSAVGSIHPTSVGTTYNIDITPLVSAWSAGANNYGVVIIGQGAVVGDTAYFHSDDAASLTDRPLLTVEYQEPSGGGGAVPEPGNLALIGIGAGLTSVLRKRKAK